MEQNSASPSFHYDLLVCYTDQTGTAAQAVSLFSFPISSHAYVCVLGILKACLI